MTLLPASVHAVNPRRMRRLCISCSSARKGKERKGGTGLPDKPQACAPWPRAWFAQRAPKARTSPPTRMGFWAPDTLHLMGNHDNPACVLHLATQALGFPKPPSPPRGTVMVVANGTTAQYTQPKFNSFVGVSSPQLRVWPETFFRTSAGLEPGTTRTVAFADSSLELRV